MNMYMYVYMSTIKISNFNSEYETKFALLEHFI